MRSDSAICAGEASRCAANSRDRWRGPIPSLSANASMPSRSRTPGFDQSQSALHGRPGALPGRAEWRRLGTAAQTGTIACAFRRGGTWIEADVARVRGSCRAYRPAVDSGGLDRREHHAIERGVAPAQGIVLDRELGHAANLAAMPPRCERWVVIRSENDRCACQQSGPALPVGSYL